MRRFRARWLALLASTAIALYLCWLMLRPFIEVLLWGGVLAIVAYPLHLRLLRRTGKPALAAALTCGTIILTVVVPLTLVSIAIVGQAKDAATRLRAGALALFPPAQAPPATAPATLPTTAPAPDALPSPDAEPAPDAPAAFGDSIRGWGLFRSIDPYYDLDRFLDRQWIADHVQAAAQAVGTLLARHSLGLVGGLFGMILTTFFTLFTLFYLLRDGPVVLRALHDSLPLESHQADLIFQRTEQVISASVFGVLVIAGLQGLLGGLAFLALGLPSPVLWGFVMFLLSMLPLGGAAIVWAPAAIFLLATGHPVKALVLAAWGGGVIGTIDNVLRPRLVGGKTRLHELVVFFSVLGGLQVFGVLGLFVGPVVVALTIALLDVLRQADAQAVRPVAAGQSAPQIAEESSTESVPAARAEEPAATPAAPASPAPAAAPAPRPSAPRQQRKPKKKWKKR